MGYGSAMIRKANQRGYQPALPGIERKTLVYGERTLLTDIQQLRTKPQRHEGTKDAQRFDAFYSFAILAG